MARALAAREAQVAAKTAHYLSYARMNAEVASPAAAACAGATGGGGPPSSIAPSVAVCRIGR